MADLFDETYHVFVGLMVGSYVIELLSDFELLDDATPQDRYDTYVAVFKRQIQTADKAYQIALEELGDDSTRVG